MKKSISLVVLATCLGSIYCQLTGITLDPLTVTIAERHVGNLNVTTVTVIPAGTIVNCDIIQVKSGTTTSITNHPFQRSFELLGPSNIQWYVYFDGVSLNKLDFDVYPNYQLTVECSGTTGTASEVLVVTVVENQGPVVSDIPTVSITKSAPTVLKGDLLYTVTASDPDGEPLTFDYQILPPVNYFDINTITNEIRAGVDFLAVGISPVTITVLVSDGDKSEQLTIDVTVTNTNVRPEITNLPTPISLPENSPGGMELFVLQYLDPDQTHPFIPTCTITPNTQSQVFNIIGSRVYLAARSSGESLLDFETITTHEISCTIFDQFLYSNGPDILTITITDVNEGPVFNKPSYVCQIEESKALVSTCILGMNVQDPEGDPFTISIIPTTDSQRLQFTSQAADGLTFSVDYDIDNNVMPRNVLITIEAKDNVGQIGTAQIQVTVLDKNDNSPVFVPAQIIDLTPSTLVGTVGVIDASDADSDINSQIEYTLISVNPTAASEYVIILSTGQIHYTKKFPDSIKDSTALLNIRASDKGSPSRSSTGIVTIRFLGDTTAASNPNIQQATNSQSVSQADKTFFDEPANIAIVAVLGVVLLVLLLVVFYFCIKKMLLGYCCGPRKPSNVYPISDDYRFQNDINNQRYNTGYSGHGGDPPDYYRNYTSYSDFNRGGHLNRPPSTIKDFYDDRSMRGNPY